MTHSTGTVARAERGSLRLGLAALALLAPGCGGETRVERHPVSGQVLFRGRPAAGAMIVFHDTRPKDELRNLPIPRASSRQDGTFELSSYELGDGAPAGTYRVTVVLPEAVLPADPPASEGEAAGAPDEAAAATVVDPESAPSPRDVLKERYSDPATSGLEVTIAEGRNNLPPFELE